MKTELQFHDVFIKNFEHIGPNNKTITIEISQSMECGQSEPNPRTTTIIDQKKHAHIYQMIQESIQQKEINTKTGELTIMGLFGIIQDGKFMHVDELD